jgi:hypothetical protein
MLALGLQVRLYGLGEVQVGAGKEAALLPFM